ncbi:hypothetical protein COV11_00850 [Candidatus Woesearchaeota archaeon CG10_big_fil_rev_8_21_14_0_10_30_7]|nr:MAG: hypothetical protein COV11_00850 [Candidatus Woesearchaeota archaeon CG10_big_fil_rev_8_21_14_0_10_30_7]
MKKKVNNEEKIMNFLIIAVIIFGIIILLFTVKSLFFPANVIVDGTTSDHKTSSNHFSSGKLTEYDLALAKRIMDKDGDGKCDVCGMDVEFCIQNGQVQCNMGENTEKFKIGVLDTTKQKHHYQADFKVYINGKELDFNQQKYFVKSRFVHVENDEQGDSGKVLHMHASGVPLWLFFESIGMNFDNECFTQDTKEKYCNDKKNNLKFYVNGKLNNEFEDYVFQDNDKLLISYGSDDEDVTAQIESVTAFSPNH